MSTGNWQPPPSLRHADVARIVADCEDAEVLSGATAAAPPAAAAAAAAAVVHMASLLYLNDAVAARHLWRRYRAAAASSVGPTTGEDDSSTAAARAIRSALEPWWTNVGANMLSWNLRAVWDGLNVVRAQAASSSSSLLPADVVGRYVDDVADSYRRYLLRGWVVAGGTGRQCRHYGGGNPLPDYDPRLLGLASGEQLRAFVAEQRLLSSSRDSGIVGTEPTTTTTTTDAITFLEGRDVWT